MFFLPNQHEDDDDSLSSISSTSPTPVSATMATPPHSPSRSRLLMQKHNVKSPLLSPPKLIIEERHVEPTTYTRRRIERGISNHNNIPARSVRISIDMRTRSSRLFFVLLHLVGVSKNVPSNRSTYNRNSSNYRGSDLSSFIQKYSPEWLSWTTGIVGVHPTGILLEKLDVQSSRRGLKGIIERVERVWRWDGSNDLLGEPYWFQTNDGQCLDPSGRFGECGDSTLWRVRRRPLSKRQLREKRYKQRHRQREQERRKEETKRPTNTRRREYPENSSSVCVWPFFCEENSQFSQQPTNIGYDEVYGFEYENLDEEEEEGFALQLIGADAMIDKSFHRVSTDLNGRRRRRLFGKLDNEQEGGADECLLSFPSSKNGGSILQTGKCTSDAAWTWHVNRDGILVRGSTSAEKRRRQRRWKLSPQRASTAAATDSRGKSLQSSPSDFGCVHQTNSTVATLLPCGVGSSKKKRASTDSTLVEFSLVRYPTTSYKSISPQKQQEPAVGNVDEDSLMWEPWITLDISQLSAEEDSQTQEETTEIPPQNLPHSRRSSHSQATAGAKQPTLKSTTNMLHTSLDQGKAKKDVTTSASHIRNAPVAMNGVAFHKQRMMDKNSDDKSEGGCGPSKGPTSTKIRLEKKKNKRQSRPSGGQTPIHEDASEGSDHRPHSNPHRPRKIPVHPYIQSSKDFVWVDPLTSLEYPTDLCSYLGQTKSEAGRHTLMGVGQYYRTAFNIKVYGAALYVAKRDVLADPKFGEYATLSADDLRGRDDFYNHLMNMPAPGEDPANSIGGFFDRTLFIKINMQLSTKAMRQSLEADWSLLTEEMKATIIDSSFEERMADERMQQKIQSKENSSNCSCGQSAPPEYNADPSCCARGTELVFTWRKNGDFEVRLDGRIMDTFPRSDIARGIFAEYLNNNPISLDAKAHFADGFPFLLAPLAQVKGMSSAVPQSHEPATEEKLKIQSTNNNSMHRMMNVAMNSMYTMNTQAQSLSKWMTDSATGMTSNAIGVARGLSEELDKQRIDFIENAVEMKNEGMEMLTSLMKMSAQDNGMAVAIVDDQEVPTISPFDNTYNEPSEIIPDEIGMKQEPTMNLTHSLFFVTVHIYLVLMLLASIPRSKNERYIVRRIKNTRDI